MRYNKITQETQNITRWYDEGKSIVEITKLLPETPRTSIASIITKYKKTGSNQSIARGGPRFITVTSEFKGFVHQIISEDCTRTLSEIKNLLNTRFNVSASISSIHRAIESLSFTIKQLVKSPIARNTPEVIQKRMSMR